MATTLKPYKLSSLASSVSDFSCCDVSLHNNALASPQTSTYYISLDREVFLENSGQYLLAFIN